jgi:hypothetical protein
MGLSIGARSGQEMADQTLNGHPALVADGKSITELL